MVWSTIHPRPDPLLPPGGEGTGRDSPAWPAARRAATRAQGRSMSRRGCGCGGALATAQALRVLGAENPMPLPGRRPPIYPWLREWVTPSPPARRKLSRNGGFRAAARRPAPPPLPAPTCRGPGPSARPRLPSRCGGGRWGGGGGHEAAAVPPSYRSRASAAAGRGSSSRQRWGAGAEGSTRLGGGWGGGGLLRPPRPFESPAASAKGSRRRCFGGGGSSAPGLALSFAGPPASPQGRAAGSLPRVPRRFPAARLVPSDSGAWRPRSCRNLPAPPNRPFSKSCFKNAACYRTCPPAWPRARGRKRPFLTEKCGGNPPGRRNYRGTGHRTVSVLLAFGSPHTPPGSDTPLGALGKGGVDG